MRDCATSGNEDRTSPVSAAFFLPASRIFSSGDTAQLPRNQNILKID